MAKAGPKKVRRYSDEFKLTVVKLSHMEGVLVGDVAKTFDIHPWMLSRWRTDVAKGLIPGKPKALPKIIAKASKVKPRERRGVTEVSRAVSAFRFELGQESNDLFLPFVGIDSETDSFPMGHVRARWNPDSLAALDRERAEFEARLRPHAVEAAKTLLAYARAHAL